MTAKRGLLVIIALTVAGCAFVWYWQHHVALEKLLAVPSVPRFPTPGWILDGSELWLKSSGPTGDHIVMWCLTNEQGLDYVYADSDQPAFEKIRSPDLPFYVYEPGWPKLAETNRLWWLENQGAISDERMRGALDPFVIASEGGSIRFRKGLIATHAPCALRAAASPCGRYVAVITAAGPRRGSVGMIFGGQYTWDGPFFCEVFSRSTGARHGIPIALAKSGASQIIEPYWTGDSAHVVCIEQSHSFLWVVGVENELSDKTQPGQ